MDKDTQLIFEAYQSKKPKLLTEDHRDYSLYPSWGVKVNPKNHTMSILDETGKLPGADENGFVTFPAIYVVCPSCEGKGTCVNSAVDSQGIPPEQFAEDPEFASAYHNGSYDVVCKTCEGHRVIPEPSTPEGKQALQLVLKAAHSMRAEEAKERRFGL